MLVRLKKWLPLAWVVLIVMVAAPGCKAQTVGEILLRADGLFKLGKTEEAKQVYESIVKQDTSCLESTIWLGNYYYLKGEEKRKESERAFNALPYPSSMQSAFHQEQLKSIYKEYYMKADTLVQRALRKQPNDYLKSVEANIDAFKFKLGFAKPPVKKRLPVLKLFKSTRDSTVLP